MTNKKFKSFEVIFEDGCFDELEDEITQEDLEAFIDGIFDLAETGEILEGATRVSDLTEDEQAEIINMLERKQKRTRH